MSPTLHIYMVKHTILCVDDEIDNVEALERLFRKKYKVLKATSGPQALELLDQNKEQIAVILTDQRMPLMTGAEMLEKSIVKAPQAVRLLLTGYTDLESVIQAVNKGQIHRYLQKPWDPVDLQQTVDQAVERFTLGRELETKNRELEKALSELKTLDQAKTQFMILINHELKTPLTSILNFLSLLKETKLDEEQANYTGKIQKSSDRLKSLVDDVMLLMRAETGQLRAKVNSIHINQIVQDIPQSLQESIQKKGQKLSLQLEQEVLETDPFVVKEVIHRLLHNANKFGAEKTLIDLKSVRAGNSILISLMNRGSKFDLQKAEKLLQPFFLDESIMHHSVGTGMGLAICQALLKTLGSTLEFENLPDGAIVKFKLKT